MSQRRVPLAIVGIGCRMPGGVETPDQLWQMISAGKDGICEVPRDRWDWRRYFSDDPDAPGKIYVRNGGFLQHDIKQFDAEFFGISPREAMSLDPQQRLLLETSLGSDRRRGPEPRAPRGLAHRRLHRRADARQHAHADEHARTARTSGLTAPPAPR